MMKYQRLGGVALIAVLLSLVGCLQGEDLSAKADINVIGGTDLLVNEAGAKAIIRLSLSFAPTADVVFRFESSDVSEVLIGRGLEEDGVEEIPDDTIFVTFTPNNWSKVQKVVFYGQDDDFVDDKQTVTVITYPALSEDSRFNGLNPRDFVIVVEDDDVPGIKLTNISNLVVDESGSMASFFITLKSEPSADVTFILKTSDSGEGRIFLGDEGDSEAVLLALAEKALEEFEMVFTRSNWNDRQKIFVVGQDDNFIDGVRTFIVGTSLTKSEDEIYNDVSLADVTVRNEDDDVAAIVINADYPLVVHAANGETARFSIALTASPLENRGGVSITIEASDESLGQLKIAGSDAEPKSIVEVGFGSESWDIPIEVIIEGIDQSLANGISPFFIKLHPSNSRDANFIGVRHPDIEIVSFDLKPAIFAYPTTEILTSESGGTGELMVRLTTEPLNPVSLILRSDRPEESLLSKSSEEVEELEQISLAFTDENWSSMQRVTVHGVDDVELSAAAKLDGNQSIDIIAEPLVSLDTDYNGIQLGNIGVINIDNDEPNITITQSTSLETTDSGKAALFYVVLNSEPKNIPEVGDEPPPAVVVLNVQTSNSSEGLLVKRLGETPKFKIPLTFTPDNWSIPQVVFVRGVRDGEDDGDEIYEVTVEIDKVDTLETTGYLNVEKSVVSVNGIDDDNES